MSSESKDTSRISISAHYTGYIWYKHGLSAPEFVTPAGRITNLISAPINGLLRLLAGADIDIFLLQRHTVIDHRIEQLIENQGVTQILELACGLSPRGYRLKKKYPHIKYIEADLPGMAERKRQLIAPLIDPSSHQVCACNILEPDGEMSIEHLLSQFNPNEPTLVVTEGLVNYFELEQIRTVWSRISKALAGFPKSWYVTDLYPDFADHPSYPYVKFAQKVVGTLTQGQWPLHYASDQAIQTGFQEDGFSQAKVIDPAIYYGKLPLLPEVKIKTLVRIIEAAVHPS